MTHDFAAYNPDDEPGSLSSSLDYSLSFSFEKIVYIRDNLGQFWLAVKNEFLVKLWWDGFAEN